MQLLKIIREYVGVRKAWHRRSRHVSLAPEYLPQLLAVVGGPSTKLGPLLAHSSMNSPKDAPIVSLIRIR